jgi:hypothetical protein
MTGKLTTQLKLTLLHGTESFSQGVEHNHLDLCSGFLKQF